MKIVLAKHAGFCFGVSRAVDAVYENIAKSPCLYTYGPIIHNPQVVQQLEQEGVRAVEDISSINDGTVVIRSHGAPPEIYSILEAKGIQVIDATCPYVKRIHETVSKYSKLGYGIIIIGERNHPEVKGINGWCGGKGIIIGSTDEAKALPCIEKPVCIVAQTTLERELWDEVIPILTAKLGCEPELHCTICAATSDRQTEARELAARVDVMLVIGGRESSNTRKLYQICSRYCKRTYLIESAEELPTSIKQEDTIGITAGASTPVGLIKEVLSKMSEVENVNRQPDADFAQEMDKTLVQIRPGQVIKGTVVLVNSNEVCVNIGYKADAIIPHNEMSSSPDADIESMVKVGDEIEVEVLKVNDGEGNVLVSKKRVDSRKIWDEALTDLEGGKEFTVVCKEAVKGGVLADLNGINVFVPASQLRADGFARDLNGFVGKSLRLKALEVDKERKRVVASQKAVLQAEKTEREDAFWERIKEGDTVTGVVKRLTDFGAFVDIGGYDGLVHIGDLAWFRINHPSEVLRVGDTIDVVVLNMNREKGRVSLGYKQMLPKPWENVADRYPIGAVIRGKVVRLVTFGAFIELEPGIDGLVHISQVTNGWIKTINEVLQVGQEIDVMIMEVKPEEKRISLSIKEANPDFMPEAPELEPDQEEELRQNTDAVNGPDAEMAQQPEQE